MSPSTMLSCIVSVSTRIASRLFCVCERKVCKWATDPIIEKQVRTLLFGVQGAASDRCRERIVKDPWSQSNPSCVDSTCDKISDNYVCTLTHVAKPRRFLFTLWSRWANDRQNASTDFCLCSHKTRRKWAYPDMPWPSWQHSSVICFAYQSKHENPGGYIRKWPRII